ncbi:MAG: ATP-dependent protease, Lon family [Candidatus Syntrophonatronum acetioxidans]|uniref:endopeptidase La n=1 Tax=Candidatus Syntrophonatronum acetioxidans TaxID=1795816 RepID=A0A424YFR7_9FIRM|nr:MAG: ATP-dependent protease, Lon family [Candidatus Syntrophonatronum acetioxidans]
MKNEWSDEHELLQKGFQNSPPGSEELEKKVSALYGILGDIMGKDKLVLKASKLDSLNLLRSEVVGERILGLKKILMEDPTLKEPPRAEKMEEALQEVEEKVADLLARKAVEDSLEKRINLKMQEKHEEYILDLKKEILQDRHGLENAHTLKKFALLEKKDRIKLSRSIMEVLRPSSLEEIVGQEKAVRSLLAKVAAPYPQHIMLYGPPGVGKTTAARLALQAAKELPHTPFQKDAPFVEVDGTTLRWDPREATNPLLGSVHDPIYQGARRDLVEVGIPEPKPGLVTESHGGILFVDEIAEMDLNLQSKLLKVLEDKRVYFDSPYYEPRDERVPKYIRKLFDEGAPADFILIGATTRSPSSLNPALRSRCMEVFFEPLSPEDIEEIVRASAEKLKVLLEGEVPSIISEYTIEGRKAINIMADAYGLALYEKARKGKKGLPSLGLREIYEVIQTGRLSPWGTVKADEGREVGKIFGLGSRGYLGVVIEIEAVGFPAIQENRGCLRFNDSAGAMARDSVFNAATTIRGLTGIDLNQHDLHVNIVGGGQIEGPSAGAAVFLALFSALKDKPLPRNIAVTGEVSLRGKIKAVGGLQEKIYGAKQAGIKKVFIPRDNGKEFYGKVKGLEVDLVSTTEELLKKVFP